MAILTTDTIRREHAGNPTPTTFQEILDLVLATYPLLATPQTLGRSTTAALAAVGNAINTTGKFAGKAVINTTTGAIVTAADATAAGLWLALDGTTAHTPV